MEIEYTLKNRYTVIPIPSKATYEWLLKKHYAHRIPSISYAYGLYLADRLMGVCTFGSPPSNALCIGICGKEYKKRVLELNRLCIHENGKNLASYFIAQCFKQLPRPSILVSYADTSKHHHGYVYQATNWIYTGLSAKRTERYDPENPHKHSKTVCQGKLKYSDLAVRDRPQKHRYIYFLGDRKDRKDMLNKLKYKIHPYPKGDNQEYDASYKTTDNITLF